MIRFLVNNWEWGTERAQMQVQKKFKHEYLRDESFTKAIIETNKRKQIRKALGY